MSYLFIIIVTSINRVDMMFSRDKKILLLLCTLVFVIILSGTVSASANLLSGVDLSLISAQSTHTLSGADPLLIDSGVTYTKGYLVKVDKQGHYSTGTGDRALSGMLYPTKYYWKTYLYKDGTIVIRTHFYHTTLKKTIFQRVVIGKNLFGSDYLVYHTVSPKSWGGSSYYSVHPSVKSALNFYWKSMGHGYPSFRANMIRNAPRGPG
jgi:hypothetical protein